MSYQNKLDEINEKLVRLKESGGVSRPLVPVDTAPFGSQSKKLEEITAFLEEMKAPLSGIGAPAAVASRLLERIAKREPVERINALCDFCAVPALVASESNAVRFNNLATDTLMERCEPSALLRLSENSGLPAKKRRHLVRLAALLEGKPSAKKLSEIVVIKNEIEGYLNEKQNEQERARLAARLKNKDFEDQLLDFCMFTLGDILEPPVLPAPLGKPTVFGLLECMTEMLFLMRGEVSEIKMRIADCDNNEVNSIPVPAEEDLNTSEAFGSILDELSALKEDIKSALTLEE